MEFNSLDAQRESCGGIYLKPKVQKVGRAFLDRYDDGVAFPGGTLERLGVEASAGRRRRGQD